MLTDYRIRQRDHLLQIVRALTQQLDLESVLTRILKASTEMLGGRAGLIALRDQPNNHPNSVATFSIRAQHGVSPEFLRHFENILQNTSSTVLIDPATYIISELEQRLHILARSGPFNLDGTIGLPLEAQGNLVGLLLVLRASASPSTYNERKILQAFADHAAVAVTNARLYEQVTQEKRQLDVLLEGSADGIMILDSGHLILRWNRALAKLSGVTPATALGNTHDEIIRWSNTPDRTLSDAEARGWPFANGSPLYVEGNLQQPTGDGRAVGITYAPIFDKNKRLANIIANVRDITKFREAEQLKSTFISVISHELRTPVSLIKGYAGTLLREDASWTKNTINESITVIEEEADRLANLIDNLLEASQLQAGGLQLNLSTIDIVTLTNKLTKKFKTQTEKHTLNVSFADNFPKPIADEERILQALSNLISNAIKYSPNGGPITVSGKYTNREIIISVKDSGIGVEAGDLNKIFDRFHRVTDTETSHTQGAGLGLYLTRAIIEAHHGRIWVHSDPGLGSTFHIAIPIEE